MDTVAVSHIFQTGSATDSLCGSKLDSCNELLCGSPKTPSPMIPKNELTVVHACFVPVALLPPPGFSVDQPYVTTLHKVPALGACSFASVHPVSHLFHPPSHNCWRMVALLSID